MQWLLRRWIIGKKGSYINQMIKKSGAYITISESSSQEFGRVWRYVHIKGGGRAVDKAKKLLHIRLERLEPRGPTETSMEGNIDAIISGSEDVGSLSHCELADGSPNPSPTLEN